jgi:peptidoglycan/xylan/chitin deacetylase (PgdA/CDA1 family)
MIHVDLDGASTIFAVHGVPYLAETDPLFETGLRNCLDFLADAGLKATFFVIADDLQDPVKRGLIQEAVRAGHEIASHSLSHPKLTTLSEDAKRREVFESRAVLHG